MDLKTPHSLSANFSPDFTSFFKLSRKNVVKTKFILRKHNLSSKYVHSILLSLFVNKKLSIGYYKKKWMFDGFAYSSLADLIKHAHFISKIKEMKEFYSMFGPQLLQFDPLFSNIIFLPLHHQKTILEYAIQQYFIENGFTSDSFLIINDQIPYEQFFVRGHHFESALLTILFDKLSHVVNSLHSYEICSLSFRTYRTCSLYEFLSR